MYVVRDIQHHPHRCFFRICLIQITFRDNVPNCEYMKYVKSTAGLLLQGAIIWVIPGKNCKSGCPDPYYFASLTFVTAGRDKIWLKKKHPYDSISSLLPRARRLAL